MLQKETNGAIISLLKTEEIVMEGQQQLTQKQNFIQVIKFTIISISAGLVEMAVFALLNDVIHLGSYWVCYLPALI